MRLLTPLALVAAMSLIACGGDEPDTQTATPPQRPAPQRPAVDTTVGDTGAAASRQAGQPGTPGTGQPGQQPAAGQQRPGQAGQPAAGQPSGAAPAASSGARYTVQVAAFNDPESARAWTSRLNSQGLPVWTSMAELGGQTFYRVRVGAVPTVREARQLGTILSQRYEWPVWVAPLTPADRVPDNAVQRTRSMLSGG